MSDGLAAARPLSVRPLGDKLLQAAGRFWFVVAVIGQATFIYFILAYYGPRAARGPGEHWDEKPLIDGYISGDPMGNLMFMAHVLLAAVITLGGALQLIPAIRTTIPAFHRFSGRIFLVVAVFMAMSGIYLVWVRGTYLNIVSAWAITLDAVLIMAFSWMAWRLAVARAIDSHRRWAMRTFMVVNGVWFLRVGMMAWVILNQGPVGMSRSMDGPFDLFWAFGNFLVPLAGLELYFRAQDSASNGFKLTAAGVVAVATLLMAVGVFGTYALMWSPYL